MDLEKNCSNCSGKVVLRNGRWGFFLGCTNYPDCTYTKHVKPTTLLTSEPWLNASFLGTTKFCPNAAYLSEKKTKYSQHTRKMQKGRKAHRIASRDSRCYIATYAFSAEHPIVNGLRNWRDSRLNQHWYGRHLIYLYYKISPLLIKFFGKSWLFKKLTRIFIKWIYNYIVKEKI